MGKDWKSADRDKDKDPYSEIELYLRKAQEEISAVFGEGVSGRSDIEETSRTRTHTRPPNLDGQGSPSKIRKVYTNDRQVDPPPSPRRQLSTPPTTHPRRRVPLTRKSRRVSAPALTSARNPQNGQSSSSPEPWHPHGDPQIHEWAQGLLKDFHSLVEEEIRSLGKNSATTASTPNLGRTDFSLHTKSVVQAPSAEALSSLHSRNAAVNDSSSKSSRTGTSLPHIYSFHSNVKQAEYSSGKQDVVDSGSVVGLPPRTSSLTHSMGASQSTGRGDTWSGERAGPFKTYTLPRSRGHRSISLSGAGAINYRTSAAHPDDPDVNCELLRVNPRFSRSHSLDEGAGLSSWALHHLSVIDSIQGRVTTPVSSSARTSQATLCSSVLPKPSEPKRIPAPPPSTPRIDGPSYLNEGHYGKIRKTGYSEKHNERWRPTIVNSFCEDTFLNGSPDSIIRSNGNSKLSDSPSNSSRRPKTSNGTSALSPSDLQKGASEPWAWADQEDACALTDRLCDPNECPHCQAKSLVSSDENKMEPQDQPVSEGNPNGSLNDTMKSETSNEGNESVIHVSVNVTPPDDRNNNLDDSDLDTTLVSTPEIIADRACRKSEPTLLGAVLSSTPVDGRRHTLPAPRLIGTMSFLQTPVPTFDTSSWETLPPADELDVELEEKPISGSVVRDPSPGSLSGGSSRSLNSSLSSLSHLSIHADHSECESWPSSPVADQNLTPDVFLDPSKIQPTKDSGDTEIKEEGNTANDVDTEHSPTHSSEPITGMLQLTPIGAGGNEIIFSVSIPESTKRNQEKVNCVDHGKSSNENGDEIGKCDKSENDAKISDSTLSPDRLSSPLTGLSLQDIPEGEGIHEPKIEVREDPLGALPPNVIVEGRKEREEKEICTQPKKEGVKPPQRQRSISLTEPPTSLALNYQNKRRVTTSTQSHGPEALDDFLRAVESRIRRGSSDQPPQHLPYGDPHQHPSPSSTPTSSTTASTPTVVLDAFTQTTPTPTPQSASRASSVTWLSECGCDDLASIEPCASSLALSVTEDDYGDDDDDEEEDWSGGGSLSSSSPPPTPASMPRDDSSFSLSESLDTLDLNGESGIGTVSTRPSVSPPSHAHHTFDLSGSNLSSEDTGLENSFERQIRRYIPNNRSGRESEHSQHYRRRRPRPRHHEQWVRREDQTTQTDPHPPTLTHSVEEDTAHESYRESNETLERSRGGSEERMVRHTHSEPRLDAPLTPMGGVLRGVCSEAALPPIPTQHSNARSFFAPSAPTLPTLTEDKPPIAPTNSRPPRPRHLSLSSNHHQQPHAPSKACSAPALESSKGHHHAHHTQHTPATTPSEESSGETPVLSTRSQSAKEIAELEAIEACKWLRAAGFPQYAQMYEELQFPLDLVCVERDHAFLDRDSLQALFRRLRALNRCAKIRLDSSRKNKAEESDDEEQQCALSGNWKFQRHSRRWSRIVPDRSPTVGDKGESRGLEIPEDALLGQFKRSGSERLRDGAKAILRRMESLKNKKKKRQNRDGVVISGPKLVDEAHMQARVEELNCVDISIETSPELSACGTVTTGASHPRDVRQSTPGEDSSSLASDQSQNSTPLFRGRRRRRFWGRGGSAHGVEGGGTGGGTNGGLGGGGGGGGGAYSDSECSPPTWRHYFTDANSNKMTPSNQAPSAHPDKRSNKGGSGRQGRPGHLRHTGSLTYGKDSQAARENFLASIRGGGEKNDENVSPLPSPDDERHSVYDNVPLIICNKSYHDYQPEVMDSEASAHEGSGSSECTVESRESPLPSAHDDEEIDEPCQRRATVDRWHSFNRKSYQPSIRQIGTQINGFSSGQMLHLRKRALLRLTALMERYCPSNRSGWNWELPKFMRKMKTPDYRDRQVFGVPLLVIAQRTGQPVPPGIQAALQYLRTSSLDQVGIFRKPGVRSRIQKLREFHELGEEVQYSNFGVCDIADMVKTYFRELPEVLLTNKLSEMFIAIFQYLPVEHRLEALQCAVLLLPDENREVLMALLTFLADVAANSHLNQMHASNLAVCLAPSLFHLNVGTSGSSPLRRRAAGTPEQRDLHENKAAHQCLTLMIQQVSQLQCVPTEMLSNCRFTYLEQSQPVCLEDLGVVGSPGVATTMEGDWASYMNACITALLKEARDKSRGWVTMNCADSNVEILYRKVGDGHPLRLWRATTEVEAPPSELLNRVIRERHLWDDTLLKWRVVNRLDRQAEVFQYMCNSMPPRPPVDYCVLRCWRSDLARGTCVVVETSVEHADAPVLVGGVRGIVLASRYLIQPCGSGKSRITHISRLDMRGRTPEWYNKVYGHATAMHLTRIRQSFEHHACGPESKV